MKNKLGFIIIVIGIMFSTKICLAINELPYIDPGKGFLSQNNFEADDELHNELSSLSEPDLIKKANKLQFKIYQN